MKGDINTPVEMFFLKKMFSPIGRNIVVSGEPFYGEMLRAINPFEVYSSTYYVA